MKSKLPHLVLVEDDPMISRMYERAFTEGGFDVSTSPDGTILAETASVSQPDIILMDVRMPNFDGLEALEELKSKVGVRGIPVVMLSAYDDPEVIKKAMQLGAVRYLVKSQYEPEQIVAILRQVLVNHGRNFDFSKSQPAA